MFVEFRGWRKRRLIEGTWHPKLREMPSGKASVRIAFAPIFCFQRHSADSLAQSLAHRTSLDAGPALAPQLLGFLGVEESLLYSFLSASPTIPGFVNFCLVGIATYLCRDRFELSMCISPINREHHMKGSAWAWPFLIPETESPTFPRPCDTSFGPGRE